MGKDSRTGPGAGGDTSGGSGGPQIEDSAHKPRRRTIHVLASGAGEGDRLISYTNGTQMRGVNVVDHDVVFVVEATPEMLENLAIADRRPESGVWVRLDQQVPDPAGGFTLSSDNAQVTDMHHAVVLSDPEGNAVASMSRDGLLVELYDTEGLIIKRVNRSAEPWIRAQRGAVQDPLSGDERTELELLRRAVADMAKYPAVEWSPASDFKAELPSDDERTDGELQTAPQVFIPVVLMWQGVGGYVTKYAFEDFNDEAYASAAKNLTLVQRRTMAVRLRTIASALNGDRS